ncbi:hypothetical protein MHAE_19056 [Mycobacterium haemophilum DSM 44634]|uniref:hypothetical protein n=1 Tax=Mycobacterium haemophilum TaxID=29311 RepID=UPI000655CE6A|nr:hypothetical protein [Mycobacterium haemophilum]AKN18012.1 hypothetical protein B586_17855 [Mycobacterium haemophilum DSM 44634]MCV7342012.1 hypothetical protein [Mycobacterium haemophilum DSM 44634]
MSSGAQERGVVYIDRGRRIQLGAVIDDRFAARGDDPHDRCQPIASVHASCDTAPSQIHVFLGHHACGQHQTCLCQHATTGLPPIGRSRTHTGWRFFARVAAPQSGRGTHLRDGLDHQLTAGIRGG